jgi:DNA repair protein RadC
MKTTVFIGKAEVKWKAKKNPIEHKIRSSRDAYNLLKAHIGKKIFEQELFITMYMNKANTVLWIETITQGCGASCSVDIPAITRRAIEGTAHAVIVAHNHPSGNKNPSENDKRVTKNLKKAIKPFNIEVLDHIIVCGDGYYSFADNGERSLA